MTNLLPCENQPCRVALTHYTIPHMRSKGGTPETQVRNSNFMNYDIEAKPTKYNGRLYRSRLEARWAAFFDLLGWEFEYEPFDLNGWSPDFSIKVKYGKHDANRFRASLDALCKKVVTQVGDEQDFGFKKDVWHCECGASSEKFIEYETCPTHLKGWEIIETICLVEVKPIDHQNDSVCKKMTDANQGRYELLLLGNSPIIEPDRWGGSNQFGWLYENDLKWGSGWGEAIWTRKPGFAHQNGSFGCRIEGTGGGSDEDLGFSQTQIEYFWNEAANKVMFLKPGKK